MVSKHCVGDYHKAFLNLLLLSKEHWAYTGSNHGEQLQPESGVGRRNGGGRGNGDGRGNDVREEPPVVINNGSNEDNNGNRNDTVFCDRYSTICVAEPAIGDPRYKQWKSENSLIIVWLELTAYYNELLTLWQELDLCYDDNWTCTSDIVLSIKRQGNDSVFMFLTGLNKDLDEVRGRVLGKVPLSTLHETFAEIRREEARQGVMMGKTPRNSESKGSTLATRNLDEGRRSDKVPWCDQCKPEWHTHETYWKLKGKPPNWKKKNGCAFQANNSDQGQQPPPSQFPLTTEQLDRLYKLLESPTPSYSIATKRNSAFLSDSLSHTWIVDSGASDHMTGESSLFSSYSPCEGFELREDDWQC
ncbi:hypothetical protein KIW84_010543 [Lathyrus oleraceus]|uniref:Retrovirus-related Pol polyprotein from transposon TNT 1-94-like beta-barrel domain-containing protein n=1 Tax=Pisum sativum TaxID=3888 RepID=A0A9D4YP37_PEA|nr:hypothetical protein KIW84_010543 [Pisum sativum]